MQKNPEIPCKLHLILVETVQRVIMVYLCKFSCFHWSILNYNTDMFSINFYRTNASIRKTINDR